MVNIRCSILGTDFSPHNLLMASISLPSTFLQSSSCAFTFQQQNWHQNVKYNKNLIYVSAAIHSYSSRPLPKTSFLLRRNSGSGLLIVPHNAKNFGAGEEDGRALETVLKLYTAIKDRDLNVLSDVIGEECRCVCNFVSTFQSWEGKPQVLKFFSYLLGKLGDNIEFVVQPTLQDGMTVGVHWRLEWKETSIPLGKGFSFYMCHVYQGKVLIKNVEMFMEPLLHIEPLRLKFMGTIMNALDNFATKELPKDKAKRTTVKYMFLALLFFIAALLFFLKFSFD